MTKSKKKKRNLFKKIFLTLFCIFCVTFFAGTALFAYYAKDAPKLEDSKLEASPSTKIYDSNGKLIYNLGDTKRETISTKDIPQQLKDAIISIEDRRFYKHIGIDPIRIAGAFVSNLQGTSLQGGSTLTQQLIKLSYFSTKESDQTLKRKIQEAWLSIQLEREKSKDQILDYYINKVYMDNNLYGMETAAKTYFGKSLNELSLAQTALLAGMPQAPTTYNPYTNPKAAKNRRDLVLHMMYENGKISKTQLDKATKVSITSGLKKLEKTNQDNNIVDNYVTEVIKEVEKTTGKDPYKSGMKIYTNLNMGAQKYLYELLNDNKQIVYPVDNPHKKGDELKTAVTIMDVNNGGVIAQLGDRDVQGEVQRGQNLAVDGKRDVGSTTKPFTDYAPAIELLHLSTAQRILDEPYFYSDTDMQVHNYDKAYKGTLTMRQALADSRNVPAMKLFDAVGASRIEKFLKDRFDYEIQDGINQASAISQNMSTTKLASIYCSFANGGTYYHPEYVSKIKFSDGTEKVYHKEGKKALSSGTAYMMTDMMKNIISPQGLAAKAYIPSVIQAGKTGTSNYADDVKDKIIGDPNGVPDVSMVGYTTKYCVAVWSGYTNYFQSISPQYQDISQLVYKYMMMYLTKGQSSTNWKMPNTVSRYGNELYLKGYPPTNSLLKSLYPQINKRVNIKPNSKQSNVQNNLPNQSNQVQANRNGQVNNANQQVQNQGQVNGQQVPNQQVNAQYQQQQQVQRQQAQQQQIAQ